MELYSIISAWTGWPIVVAVMIIGGSLIYTILKENINSLRDENRFIKTKLEDATNNAPDRVVERVLTRHKLLSEEIEELKIDELVNVETISKKESELQTLKEEIEQIKNQLMRAEELIGKFTCPHCGAPLDTNVYHTIWDVIDGKDIDGEIEISSYECGFETQNGVEVCKCQRSTLKGTSVAPVSSPRAGF
jgi:hypothetical protein